MFSAWLAQRSAVNEPDSESGYKTAYISTMNHRTKLIQDLEVCGQRIRTCTYKTQDESTPLLICNGFGVSSELLEPLVEAMGEKTIILFDAPGTGESSTPLLPYSMFRLAAMLDRLLNRLGYDQADIMGKLHLYLGRRPRRLEQETRARRRQVHGG